VRQRADDDLGSKWAEILAQQQVPLRKKKLPLFQKVGNVYDTLRKKW
jgi:hypothetical protein